MHFLGLYRARSGSRLALCLLKLSEVGRSGFVTCKDDGGGLVPAESLQVLYTDFPSSRREKKGADLQRQHTQVVNCLHPVLLGCEGIHSSSPHNCDFVMSTVSLMSLSGFARWNLVMTVIFWRKSVVCWY